MARRSLLFSPGDRPEMLRKAPAAGADVVIFDLEDAVAPDRKDAAREAVNAVLSDPDFDPAAEVCVRVNPAGIAADDDIEAAIAPSGRADLLVLPMVEAAADVETLSRLLSEHDLSIPVFAAIETARGLLAAAEIADAAPTAGLVFGGEDFRADIGASRTPDATEVLYARQRVVVAASAAGIDAIDTVFTDVEDRDGLREAARFAADLGFTGKVAIHPRQVGPINEAFTPAPDEVAWARRVLAARDDHEGSGVFRVDDEMIDAPVIARAERVVARAEAAEAGEDDTDTGQ